MRKFCGWFVLPVVLSSSLAAQSPAADSQRIVAIRHATVIDVTGGPARQDETVVIVGDRIARVGKSGAVAVPHGAQMIEGRGKFLIPGLWDMHVHPTTQEYLPLFIANGITGIRVMWGSPEHYVWRKQIDSGQMTGPHMVIGSPIVDGPKPYWPRSISVSTEEEARGFVDQSKEHGADFVKIYQFLPREEYFAIAEEAHKQGIPYEGHVPISVSAEEASRAGQKSFEHLIGILPACSTRNAELLRAQQADLDEGIASGHLSFWGPHVKENRDMMLASYSPEKADALFAVLKSNGTWQCPTLTLLHMFAYGDDPAILKDQRLQYLPAAIKASWDPTAVDGKHTEEDFAYGKREFEKDLEVVGAMQKAGVGILAGTDTINPYCFPGFGLHDELGFLVQAGLSPMQALQAATLNPVLFLGRQQDMGTVEAGKIADLVLLDANPLDNIANTRKIDAVIFDGRVLDRPMLDAMLAQVRAIAARKPIGDFLFATVQEKGAGAAVAQYRELQTSQPTAWDFSEDQLITLGYRLIHLEKFGDAIAIFRLSVEAFPQSYNTWDSLAEAYMDNGDRQLAIENYEKSLEINPKNTNGILMLKKLRAQ